MLKWLKSLVGGKSEADQVSAEWKLIRELAPMLAEMLVLPIRAARKTPATLFAEQPAFACGYVVGLADVMSQSAGGDPGRNLSQNLALRLMIELLGQKEADEMWPHLTNYMASDSPEFEQGMSIGGQDGNCMSNKGLPRNLGEHLGLKVPGTMTGRGDR